jgi:thymidylate synthase
MQQYLQLMRHVLDNGTKKDDRTGTGTYSVFSYD